MFCVFELVLACDFDCAVGAHNRAECTTCASTVVGAFDGVVPALVKSLVLHLYDAFRTGVHTQAATLAAFKIELEFHCLYIPFYFINKLILHGIIPV